MPQLKNEKQLLRFEYDFAVDGGDVGAIDLRPDITQLEEGMIVTGMIIHAEAELDGDPTPTVTFGDGTTAAAFAANQYGNLDSDDDVVHISNLAVLLGEDPKLVMTVGAENLTAGKLEVYMEVISK